MRELLFTDAHGRSIYICSIALNPDTNSRAFTELHLLTFQAKFWVR